MGAQMTPTPEQLEAVEAAIRDIPFHDRAREAWDVIAPMVLEQAAAICDRMHGTFAGTAFGAGAHKGASYCADRIRVLARGK